MEIRLIIEGPQIVNGDPGASDVTNTYRVTDNGQDFKITCRSYRHGISLGIAGEQGVLYTDRDDNTVRRQVLAVGRGCGIGVESDELVEGLSPWALRGVVLADRQKETREITLTTTGRPESASNEPVVIIDGNISDLTQYL